MKNCLIYNTIHDFISADINRLRSHTRKHLIEVFFLGEIFLRKVEVLSPKIVVNLPCKEEPFRCSGLRDPLLIAKLYFTDTVPIKQKFKLRNTSLIIGIICIDCGQNDL